LEETEGEGRTRCSKVERFCKYLKETATFMLCALWLS